jgi:hypothetical protein
MRPRSQMTLAIPCSYPDENGQVQAHADQRAALLKRAAAMEASLEALLVKLAVERELERISDSQKAMACFREGLQCLRESIERNVTLRTRGQDVVEGEWKAQGGLDGTPGRAYAALKYLAGQIALIATSAPDRPGKSFDAANVGRVVREVTTSAPFRNSWWTYYPPKEPVSKGK